MIRWNRRRNNNYDEKKTMENSWCASVVLDLSPLFGFILKYHSEVKSQ